MTGDRAAVRLSGLARGLFASLPEAAPFLRGWPDHRRLRAVPPCRLPVLDGLGAARAFAAPATAPFVDALVEASGTLAWHQTYTAAQVGQAFLDCYGWTEFIGSRGPIPSDGVACGVLMLGPGADYPLHAHAAEELYLPIAGTALWRRGEGGYVLRPPGQAIHHPPLTPHAMRTGAEPLLALYLWRGGDLAEASRLMASD